MRQRFDTVEYIELFGEDLVSMKAFYGTVFGWKFVDFWSNYFDIFSFPGGRRFQFLDPTGNELGVWCNRETQ